MPVQFSTDRLLSLANAGCPLDLAVAACCCCLFVHGTSVAVNDCSLLSPLYSPSVLLLATVDRSHLPLGSLLFALACDHCLLCLSCCLLLLFVHMLRVRWFRCPSSSLLIACSRLPTLDCLSVCPVGCLLLLLVRPHPPPGWLSTDCLLSLANAGCPLRLPVLSAACCCLFVHLRRVRWC